MKCIVAMDANEIYFYYGFCRLKYINFKWEEIAKIKIENFTFVSIPSENIPIRAKHDEACIVFSTNIDNLKPVMAKHFFTEDNRLIYFGSTLLNNDKEFKIFRNISQNRLYFTNVRHKNRNKIFYFFDAVLISITTIVKKEKKYMSYLTWLLGGFVFIGSGIIILL